MRRPIMKSLFQLRMFSSVPPTRMTKCMYAMHQFGQLKQHETLNRLPHVSFLIKRNVNTTKKEDEGTHAPDCYDPEYINSKRPAGPKTAKDFADVANQKVTF